ncbi:MAG: hypothetical protein LRY66_09260 [Saccharospirillaceae bacterium]|nr:hypothetical protein [Saccharospirillaceae bacterium]
MAEPKNSVKTQAGASLQEIGMRKRLNAWAANHQLVAVETLMRLLSNRWAAC